MKIILVNAYLGPIPGLGLAYLASALRKEFKNEIEVKVFQRKFKKNLFNDIIQERPDIIGYISFTYGMVYLTDLIKQVDKSIPTVQIIGGPHITALPEDLPKETQVGAIGAGEDTICELVKIYIKKRQLLNDDLKKVKGIVFRDNGQLVVTEKRIFSGNLDDVPLPARDLLNVKSFFPMEKGPFPLKFFKQSGVLTTRGCPFDCIFCQEKILGKYISHSPSRALKEIEELVNIYDVNFIEIMDDQFAVDVERLEQIVLGIERKKINKKAVFFCHIRADQVNDRVSFLLKRMNVKIVFIGFESGSDRVLKYLKQESCSVEKNQRAFDIFQRYKIHVYGSFIFGSPQETMEDMEKTYNFIKKNKMALAETVTLTPLPGTRIWDYAEKRGLVSKKMNWDSLLIRVKGDGQSQPWLCENVSYDEFYKFYISKVLPLTWHYQQVIKDFNFFDLLRPAFFVNFLKRPRFYLSMFKHTLADLILREWKTKK